VCRARRKPPTSFTPESLSAHRSIALPTRGLSARVPQGRPREAVLLEAPYAALAALLGCAPRNVAVVNSATAAWQRAFLGLPLWLPGSRIVTSVAEYGSNFLAYLQARRSHDL
jgi:selenocysteine lyase/cysteine desulfurase